MNRQSTLQKEKIVIKEFHRLLRSGKDYTTNSMYTEAGAKCFLEGCTAGNIVRKYYQQQITEDMRMFVNANKELPFRVLMKDFSDYFNFCPRESRLILGYIK